MTRIVKVGEKRGRGRPRKISVRNYGLIGSIYQHGKEYHADVYNVSKSYQKKYGGKKFTLRFRGKKKKEYKRRPTRDIREVHRKGEL